MLVQPIRKLSRILFSNYKKANRKKKFVHVIEFGAGFYDDTKALSNEKLSAWLFVEI